MKSVLMVGGYYATNIGNAFYEMGIMHVLNSIDGICVYKASDIQDFGWNMNNSKRSSSFNPCCSFRDIDYLILTGPAISKYTLRLWKPLFNHCKNTQTKIMFVSAGANAYDEDELKMARAVLAEIHPYALISRDHYTYEHYKDLFEIAVDGMCFATFIPEFFHPYLIETNPYLVVNFEKQEEPCFVKANESDKDAVFFDGNYWKVFKRNKNKRRFPSKDPKSMIFDRFVAVHTKNTCFSDYKNHKYKGDNIYLSDVPEDYLSIFYNAEAVISDRVHTCVASLVLGKPTMFLGSTRRANLFPSIIGNQFEVLNKQFVQIDPFSLNSNRENLRQELKRVLLSD